MIYFTTEDYIKTETPVCKNVDIQNVSPWVRPACETRLIPILGRHFYKFILTKYNTQTLTPDEQELVKQIQPCVAWKASSMALYSISRPLKNTGLQQMNSQNANPVNLEEVTYGIETYEKMSVMYERMLIDYIVENKSLFPEFLSNLNKDAKLRKGETSSIVDGDLNDSIMII